MSIVYRVIAGGTHIQRLEHVESKGNGWHRYRVLEPDPMAGHEFSTRRRNAHCTPLGAVLHEIGVCASRLQVAAMCLSEWPKHAVQHRKAVRDGVDSDVATVRALLLQAEMLCQCKGGAT